MLALAFVHDGFCMSMVVPQSTAPVLSHVATANLPASVASLGVPVLGYGIGQSDSTPTVRMLPI